MVETAEDVHQRALAGAAGAHQRDQLPSRDLKRNTFEHRQIDLTQVIGLADVLQSNELLHRLTFAVYGAEAEGEAAWFG